MPEIEYKIVKYAEQQSGKSPGVAAGMWSIVRITTEDYAFAETEGQANAILQDLRKLQRVERVTSL